MSRDLIAEDDRPWRCGYSKPAIEVRGGQPADVAGQLRFGSGPLGAHGSQIRVRFRLGHPRRRRAVQPVEPNHLGSDDVHERVAHRAEAGAKIARELLRRECRAGVERARVGPGVVRVECANFFRCHRESPGM